ncbi:hypothetical protein OGAPHI_001057 [Ogataea philodendri]|uniref:Peroxisomal membrane protein PEX13 n=1 Tax=Ogataea philodendri TaxID=1378263 RepID=A0A9P8PFX8_9ASCO|nr:uncharacterized protein OGAPHI_001057 [Ogataea philodendri]KAH3670542.1 hypothetical protein OGAPHI_001057 [Ogataea philodendri]
MTTARPKPWETGTSTASTTSNSTGDSVVSLASTGTSTTAPELPEKPSSLTANPMTSLNGSNMLSRTSPYYGGYGNYGSNSMYGGGMYNSYGSYGSSMYGSLYGNGMYGNRYGRMGDMGGMNNGMMGQGIVGSFTQGTEATFQLIESMIGAVGGFTQMLESTYYATHNSFFTMMSMAEQFQHLKSAMGSLLGIYALSNWIKKALRAISGGKIKISVDEFKKKIDKNKNNKDHNKDRMSLKPLLFFLAAVVGLPYVMKKLVAQMAQQQRSILNGPEGRSQGAITGSGASQDGPVDAKKLEFARALYDFNPENEDMELKLKRGDLVAILNNADSWWKCRTRDGRMGFVPYNYLQVIKRTAKEVTGVADATVKADVEEFKKLKY